MDLPGSFGLKKFLGIGGAGVSPVRTKAAGEDAALRIFHDL